MATVLMTWELGGGLGHVLQLHAIGEQLVRRGHRVVAALRDVSHNSILSEVGIEVVKIAAKTRALGYEILPPRTYAHLLFNLGFCESGEAAEMVQEWRNLYATVHPDLILFDHSPTALIAARGVAARRVLLGHGFFCPPDEQPLASLITGTSADARPFFSDEQRVLAAMNAILDGTGGPRLQRLGHLWSQVDETFLTTFRELDHFPQRPEANYRGTITAPVGQCPRWPPSPQKRIYCYLKPFPALQQLLHALAELQHSTIVSMEKIPAGLQEKFAGSPIQFEVRRLDLQRVAAECDVAVLHGTHGTNVSMLLAGKPTLQVPIFMEQALFAKAVTRLGAALTASSTDSAHFVYQLRQLLEVPGFTAAAKDFRQKYRHHDPAEQLEFLVERIEQLLT